MVLKRITQEVIEERMHFDRMYDSLRKNFPLQCTKCPIVYKNELDYNDKTTEVDGVTNGLDFGMGFLFFRNCVCETTLGLSINPKKWDFISQADFITYLNRRTDKKVKRLEYEAMKQHLQTKISNVPISTIIDRIRRQISRESVYEQVLLEIRDEYNTYLREIEHHK